MMTLYLDENDECEGEYVNTDKQQYEVNENKTILFFQLHLLPSFQNLKILCHVSTPVFMFIVHVQILYHL